MIGFCNPHNPMGMLYTKEDLDYLLTLSEKYGFYIMNDEIWSDMIYPEAHFNSLLEFGPERNKRTLTVYGLLQDFRCGRPAYWLRICDQPGKLR